MAIVPIDPRLLALHAYVERLLAPLPSHLRPLVIVAGGALRSYYDSTEVRDIDLFFRSQADFAAVDHALSEEPGFEFTNEVNGAVEYLHESGITFNLVGFAFGTMRETIERFDFTCCQHAAEVDEGGRVAVLHGDRAKQDAMLKRLLVTNNNGTERTLRRMAKYVSQYGYTVEDIREDANVEPATDVAEDYPDTLVPLGTFAAVMAIRKRLRRCPRPTGGGYG